MLDTVNADDVGNIKHIQLQYGRETRFFEMERADDRAWRQVEAHDNTVDRYS